MESTTDITHIVSTPGIRGGKPRIRGHRIAVHDSPTFLRYYLDEHLPPAIAQQLRARGLDALAAVEVGRAARVTAPEEMRDQVRFCE